jgi:electron transport complex protein RnfC
MPYSFAGGVHPPEEKEATEALATRELPAPETLVVPLQQHTGAPATPVVKQGDRVAKGTLLGEPSGFISAAVHSPVSGEVVAIERRPLALGSRGLCVIIRNDGAERWAVGANVETDTSALNAAAIRDGVRAAGIVGMGGAAFPTHVKLSPPENKPIDTLIINGAECEPYLTADHRLMLEDPQSIVLGADLARRAVGASKLVFAVEANKPDAFESLKAAIGSLAGAEAVLLPTRYPQGAEKQLIKAITGREVPSGGLPMDAAVVVQNVATCSAIYYALRFKRPLIERIVTVTGPCAASPGNFRVRVGTPYADLLRAVGFSRIPKRIVMGGPMMGIAQRGVEIPVTKGTSGLILLDAEPPDTWSACIRCGKCVRGCPVSIMPNELSVLIEFEQLEAAAALDLADCIECGCCAYVCPSKRPIVNWVKAGKAELAARRAKQRKASK